MDFKRFTFYNNLMGWLIFAVAAIVYLSTKQPTTSLWDCGEYIAAAFKMQVVHPPGRPMFLLLNNFFTMFAPGDTWVAPIMNGVSSISGALSAMFVSWSTVMLALRFYPRDEYQIPTHKILTILGAGVIAGLAFTFSTTSWFTAVEAEVYAMSATFVGLLFWLLLKWDRRAHQPDHMRWIVLIAFVLGVSIGVHLLGLLIIPGLAILIYFRFYEFSWKGLIISLLAGILTVGIILSGLITGLPYVGAYMFDLTFVNSFGLPIWSGVVFMILLFFGLLGYGVYYTSLRSHLLPLHVFLICIFMVSIGYSTYTTVGMRAMADPPINMNDPDEAFAYHSYINREQYGDSPLLYGQYFTAEVVDHEDGRDQYVGMDGQYNNVGSKPIRVYDEDHKTVFPRAWSIRGDHQQAYRNWMGLAEGQRPTFAQNISFMFDYQLGHMYWRYLAWNFIGRQNDIQNTDKGFQHGNWMTGIKFFDENFLGLGPQDELPLKYEENKGRHYYYGLPFILGLFGIWIIMKRRWDYGAATLFVFFLTGAGIIIALNPTPLEPRERDYAFLGSFLMFCIFIGLGLIQLVELLRNSMPNLLSSIGGFVAALLLVPLLMAFQNWEGHDRSNDYSPRDYAINYLESVGEDAILFTSGDNDTYPLWYAQEVEGIRDDVRIVNLSLLNTGWYQRQIRLDQGPAKGVELSTPEDRVVQNKREQIFYRPGAAEDQHFELQSVVDFIASDEDQTQITRGRGRQTFNFFPTQNFKISVDREKVVENDIVPDDMHDRIVDEVTFEIDRNHLMKADYLTFDIIASNNWERPIHFAMTTGQDSYLNMTDYFQMDGMTYQLVPIENRDDEVQRGTVGRVHTDIMFDNVMNDFQWGNVGSDEDVYLHSVAMRQARNMRNIFQRLGIALVRENENERAIEAMNKAREVLPRHNVPYDVFTLPLLEIYYQAGGYEEGEDMAYELLEVFDQELEYYSTLAADYPQHYSAVEREAQRAFHGLQMINRLASDNDQEDLEQESEERMDKYPQLQQQMQRPAPRQQRPPQQPQQQPQQQPPQ